MADFRTTPEGVRWSVDPHAAVFPGGYRLLRAEAFIPPPPERVFPFFAAAESLDGIPFGWRTEISGWDPPFAFTDTQLRGPHHTWIHRHTFEEVEGGTRMLDEVRWRVPRSGLPARRSLAVRHILGFPVV